MPLRGQDATFFQRAASTSFSATRRRRSPGVILAPSGMRFLRRYVTHAFALLVFALAASVAVHGVGYVELGRLADAPVPSRAPRSRPSQMEFMEMDPLPPTAPEIPAPPQDRPPIDEPPSARPPSERSTETAATAAIPPSVLLPLPSPEPEERQPEPEPEATPPPEMPNLLNQQVVEQTSDDPDVEPPPDARFLAAQNRRVEEETQAEETSVRSDSPISEPPPPDETLTESTEPEDVGRAPPEESPREVAERASEGGEVGETREPPRAEPDRPATSATPPGGLRAGERVAPSSGGRPSDATETVTIDDGFGTFSVTRPRVADSGGAGGGDPRIRGEGGRARGGHGTTPRLGVGFAAFEQIYGTDRLAEERRAVRAAREAAASSGAERREERWQQYRFAAENFLPAIRPGNQTALNAAASPFATFLAGMHRDIHQEFAEQFLLRIESSRGALADMELFTELEIVLAADGRVLSMSISRTSGVSAFDLGAIGSVMDAQPFDAPPDAIKSGDGRVYLLWGFSREPLHACHVTQARPFILPNPPPLRIMPGVEPDRPDAITAGAARPGPWRAPAGVLRTTPTPAPGSP